MASLTLKIRIYLAEKAQIALLFAKKVTVLVEYADFANLFLKKSARELPKRTGITEYIIKLTKWKQSLYRFIYSLGLLELETLKTYIIMKLANNFIQLSKSPASTLILFFCKLNNSFYLCANYQGLNNLTIINHYSLFLISESLNWFRWAKRFI